MLFNSERKLELALQNYINNKISIDRSAGKLLNIFEEMDQQGDGELPLNIVITRFQEYMQIESVLEEDLKRVITKMDKNGDGYIQYTEFLEAAQDVCIMISDLYLSHAFDLFDLGDDIENAGQIPIDML